MLSLTGCELLNQQFGDLQVANTPENTYLCETSQATQVYEEFCSLRVWTEFIIDADILSWSERNQVIKNLGDEPKQKLQKILLSQAIETPYTNRLRAQNWLNDLKPLMDEKMVQVIEFTVEKPSQQILELESAISILSRVNSRQEKSINDLQETLNIRSEEIQKQRDQVEQLLKIEANMSGEKRSN
jgi:hypothetical protein